MPFTLPIFQLALFVSLFMGVGKRVIAQEAQPAEKPNAEWVYLTNEELRVGLLRSHGGAVAYLSESNSEFNVLNHYDHGRLVQQSYYGDEDGSKWVKNPWRYNPVQGGDYKGHPASVTEFTSDTKTAYAKTIPRHWASGELLPECVMEQWIELQGNLVKARYQFTYNGSVNHKARHQETPAVFVSPKLSTLVTYTGNTPWSGGELTRRKPGWPNEHLYMPENWAAYVGDDGKGVGIYVPNSSEATCYRFEGGSGSDCSYIAPLRTFALTKGLTFTYTAYLTLGTAESIRERFSLLNGEASLSK